MLVKKFVYIERSKGSTELDFVKLKNYIKHRISIEKLGFNNNSNENIFQKKWKNFPSFLT